MAAEERLVLDEGANYGEAVMWAYWLETFTADILADSMMISDELGERFCIALCFNGTCRDCGDGIYEVLPLPKGPSVHLTLVPPEMDRRIGVYSEAPPSRGLPVAGTSGGKSLRVRRTNSSTVGRKRSQGY